MADTYGIIEALRRTRQWTPLLKTEGQRLVLLALASFCGTDGQIQPTSRQVADVTGYRSRSVRRIIPQLEDRGAIARIGERPVIDSDGIARGGRIIIWTIPIGPSEDLVGDSQEDSNRIPIGAEPNPNRTLRGTTLKVEKLKEHKTNPSPEKNDPQTCGHRVVDDDGYCTACASQVS